MWASGELKSEEEVGKYVQACVDSYREQLEGAEWSEAAINHFMSCVVLGGANLAVGLIYSDDDIEDK